jgi:two-component system osmolarity sensor histidine kinase EnvZ
MTSAVAICILPLAAHDGFHLVRLRLETGDFGERDGFYRRPQPVITGSFRGDAARTEASGAGLGLAIVEKAVKRMRGTLTLRNRPGRGLEVRIRLPRG